MQKNMKKKCCIYIPLARLYIYNTYIYIFFMKTYCTLKFSDNNFSFVGAMPEIGLKI